MERIGQIICRDAKSSVFLLGVDAEGCCASSEGSWYVIDCYRLPTMEGSGAVEIRRN